MKGTIRDRFLRVLLSSIFSSDFTSYDLRNISRLLKNDSSLLFDIGNILDDIVNRLDFMGHDSNIRNNEKTSDDLYSYAIGVIKRKRIAKNKIKNYIETLSPNVPLIEKIENAPVKEIIREYFERISRKNKLGFIALLENQGQGGDQYLEHILNR